MYEDVRRFVDSCDVCQRRASNKQEKALHSIWIMLLWQKIGLDVVHMPPYRNKEYLVVARDDFSGWSEAKTLRNTNSEAVV